ncbi:decaprenyl-phosphate phosphoribosyltransferase [Chitinimonas lacunae]|uniref:Decaprenyl-phosphate phosphoribosyltransferase n=1 Tax=Chitinimonas lacunae TaxID=1963018 RepID=A0ABV8MWX9_9NEIS
MKPYLKLIRPHQWIKNGFVLIGPLFAHRLDALTLQSAFLAFLAFCASASCVYVFNDLLDVEADRQHPTKCKRPIAAGLIQPARAWALTLLLAATAALLALVAGPWVLALVVCYWLINIAYSLRYKHVAILDVFMIASGFMLRILAGTLGLGLGVSNWLLLCGMMVTLFLGFAKRRAELLLLDGQRHDRNAVRRVLEDYSAPLLDHCISVCAAGTIVSYSLFTMSADTVRIHGTDKLIYTVPFIIYGIFRYLYLLHGHGRGNDTASDLLQDRHLIMTVGCWLGLSVWLIY